MILIDPRERQPQYSNFTSTELIKYWNILNIETYCKNKNDG